MGSDSPVVHASSGPLADMAQYLLTRPRHPTAVRFANATLRARYEQRILQRLGVSVADYAILNIHRIGVDTPAIMVWEELQEWSEGSGFWPDRLAAVERRADSIERFRVSLLGRDDLPLFEMTLLKRQDAPPAWEVDNARYLLYQCSGGYPIGVFSIYVRSRIPEEGETEQTQVFFVVAFNFYGHGWLSRFGAVRAPWQWLHDRVTSNVLNRLKARCERDFGGLEQWAPADLPAAGPRPGLATG